MTKCKTENQTDARSYQNADIVDRDEAVSNYVNPIQLIYRRKTTHYIVIVHWNQIIMDVKR